MTNQKVRFRLTAEVVGTYLQSLGTLLFTTFICLLGTFYGYLKLVLTLLERPLSELLDHQQDHLEKGVKEEIEDSKSARVLKHISSFLGNLSEAGSSQNDSLSPSTENTQSTSSGINQEQCVPIITEIKSNLNKSDEQKQDHKHQLNDPQLPSPSSKKHNRKQKKKNKKRSGEKSSSHLSAIHTPVPHQSRHKPEVTDNRQQQTVEICLSPLLNEADGNAPIVTSSANLDPQSLRSLFMSKYTPVVQPPQDGLVVARQESVVHYTTKQLSGSSGTKQHDVTDSSEYLDTQCDQQSGRNTDKMQTRLQEGSNESHQSRGKCADMQTPSFLPQNEDQASSDQLFIKSRETRIPSFLQSQLKSNDIKQTPIQSSIPREQHVRQCEEEIIGRKNQFSPVYGHMLMPSSVPSAKIQDCNQVKQSDAKPKQVQLPSFLLRKPAVKTKTMDSQQLAPNLAYLKQNYSQPQPVIVAKEVSSLYNRASAPTPPRKQDVDSLEMEELLAHIEVVRMKSQIDQGAIEWYERSRHIFKTIDINSLVRKLHTSD
eukprot:TRINITY_DN3269_c0_g1_i3.p1 TRINITY_DN3269_c0_g1~~TRINITY_DN3269_c0_g1_i3.p1  ORF type:complete len:541 (-),score=31.71 TRINITY_DN3269_c0_g1_i3:3528-5150(-)